MPEQEYKILWGGPQDIDPHALYAAELLAEHVRAQYYAHYRAGLLSSRERKLLSQLLPRFERKPRLTKLQAYNVLLAVEVLRCATTPPTDPDPLALPQAQDIDATELPHAEVDAGLAEGRAD